MSRIILLACTFTGALAVIGCTPDTKTNNSNDAGGGDDTGTTGDGGGDGGGEVFYLSISDIQNGGAVDGDKVVLEDVVVTSEFTQEGDGFFLQDQGGGPWSGIYVFIQSGTDGLFLSIGDKVTVSGEVTEYYDWTELSVSGATSIEVRGETDVTADAVNPENVADWEQWESCLIDIGAVTIADVNQYGQAEVGGGLLLDDLLTPVTVTTGGTFENLTGLVGYSFEEWILAPRAEDLQGYTPAAALTIAEIQQGGLKGAYRIENAVATSGPINDGDGFYLQDEGGGEWSGIYVYAYDDITTDLGVEPGKKYNLTASVTEYYGLTELVLQNLSDIEELDASVAVTDVVDPTTVTDWEVWESCLISIGASTAVGEVDGYGQTELDGTDIYLDDQLYSYMDDYVITNGATWTDVIGLVGQFQDSKSGDTTWKIYPRDAEDLVGYGEGEPPPDPTDATVVDVQTGVIAEGTEVTITGAVVTAVTDSANFFIQDLGGGEYSGVYVYTNGADAALNVGDVVTLTAEAVEYYDLTELVLDDASAVTVTGTDAVVADVVAGSADWEIWEGCLIAVTDVTATGDTNKYGSTPMDNGLSLDDLLFFYSDESPISSGDSWSSITGIVYYSYEEYTLNPTGADDFVE